MISYRATSIALLDVKKGKISFKSAYLGVIPRCLHNFPHPVKGRAEPFNEQECRRRGGGGWRGGGIGHRSYGKAVRRRNKYTQSTK